MSNNNGNGKTPSNDDVILSNKFAALSMLNDQDNFVDVVDIDDIFDDDLDDDLND